jgi:UDP-N-acetylglucosamine 3-dehydrogenase
VKPLRFGVVGCGAISTVFQLPTLRACPEVELVAVTDLDAAWAQKVARRFRVPEAFGDFRDLIGRVDAALVATPNTSHADITCALLEAGVHVLCEKPMATNRSDANRMFAAATRSGARLMAGHCLRFSPNMTMLRRIVAEGWLGDVVEITGAIGGPYEGAAHRTDFRRKRGLSGGGVLVDLGIHLIDLAVWIAGEAPRQVGYSSAQALPGWEVEHDADVVMEFPTAGRATISSSFTHPAANTLTVRGTAGWATASLYVATSLTVFAPDARICRRAGAQTLVLPDVSMYEAQLRHFCESVRTGGDFIVRPEEILAALGTIDECYRTAA